MSLEDLISTIKKRKVKWHDHIVRANNLSTAILQDTNLGKRQRGSDRKENHLTTLLSGLEDHSQRLRYWHTTETYGGS